MSRPSLPDGVRPITEVPAEASVPVFVHPEWRARHRWLVQGVTARGEGEPFDLALFTDAGGGAVQDRWARLSAHAGCPATAHARQVHGTVVRVHRDVPPGLHLAPPCDGHVTRQPGLLLAVTVADCVPVTLVDPGRRVVAAVHAGWRSAAGGVLGEALAALRRAFDVGPGELEVHLGPAICGTCYEVGPEVHRALGLPEPPGNVPVDVRAALARRCLEAGVARDALTVSTWCTRCGDGEHRPFFSHRAGEGERQVGFVGVGGA